MSHRRLTGSLLTLISRGHRLLRRGLPCTLPRTRVLGVACLVSLCILSAAVVTLRVRGDPRLSPLDEVQHIDYLERASHGQFVRIGELDGSLARHEASCRSIEVTRFITPPCDGRDHPASQYPELGIDTAADDPPVYYLATGIASRGLREALHLASPVTAARLLGMVWLILGVILTWSVMAELNIGLLSRLAGGALMITTPVTIISSSTVTSDATAIAAGGGCLLAALLWERGRIGLWLPVAVAFLCGLLKVTCLIGVLTAALYLGWHATRGIGEQADEEAPPPRRAVLPAVGMLVAGLAAQSAWLALAKARTVAGALKPPQDTLFHVDRLSLDAVAQNVSAGLTPVDAAPLLPPLSTSVVVAVITLLSAVLTAAALGTVAWTRRGSRAEALGLAATVTMFLAGPLYVVSEFVAHHQVFGIPHRYSLAVLPALITLLAGALAKAPVRLAVTALALTSVLVTLGRLVAA